MTSKDPLHLWTQKNMQIDWKMWWKNQT
jgi:hypothetical protein